MKTTAKVVACLWKDLTDSLGGEAQKGRRVKKERTAAVTKCPCLDLAAAAAVLSLPLFSRPPTGVPLSSAKEIMAPLKRRRLAQPSVIGALRAPEGKWWRDEFGELNGGPLKKGWLNPGAQLEMEKGGRKNTSETLKVPFHPRYCFLLAKFYFTSVNFTPPPPPQPHHRP